MDTINSSEKQKNILFTIFLAVVISILGVIFTAIENSGKYTLNILVLPETARSSINNVPISKKPLLYPGVYTLKTEAEGFATDVQQVTVEGNFAVSVLLLPISDEATSWSEENYNLYDEAYDPRLSYHTIQNQLPFKNLIFSIDAKDVSADKEVITLNIEASPGYRNAPINKITSFGYNPEDYLYNFNYKNPFENE